MGKLNRAPKVEVWSIDPDVSQALGKMVARTMAWQITIQDGMVWGVGHRQHGGDHAEAAEGAGRTGSVLELSATRCATTTPTA